MPVVVLAGRPNVGKSTLFNRLLGSDDALVADFPGLTRDRRYGFAQRDGRELILVDTGGLEGDSEALDGAALRQTEQAIREADLVLFLADARAGLCAADREIASRLRAADRPWLLAVNKAESMEPALAIAEFSALGIPSVQLVSAAHGLGIQGLWEAICEVLPPTAEEEKSSEHVQEGARIAIVGRPNTGKSTLVNRLLGEERVVVSPEPGATRDSVLIPCTWGGQPYVLVDTAGVRRRRALSDPVEKLSVMMTLRAVRAADVSILLMDAEEVLTDQDLHLLGLILKTGRGAVFCINKWDRTGGDDRLRIRSELERRLGFAHYIRRVPISALKGAGLGALRRAVDTALASSARSFGTARLNTMLQEALRRHPPPRSGRRRVKLRYAHAGGSRPPHIIIHGTGAERTPASYRRYLENFFRSGFGLEGTPLRLSFRGVRNPYT